jgi:hypothetical protein
MTQPPDKSQQFSLATLLLVTSLVAVCLGLFRVSFGLGAASLILILPAFLRTLSLVEREMQHGNRLSPLEKVTVFFGSVGVAILALVTMGAAFLVAHTAALTTCYLLAHWHEPTATALYVLGVIGAFIFALIAAAWMLRVTWPSPESFLAGLNRRDPPRDQNLEETTAHDELRPGFGQQQ